MRTLGPGSVSSLLKIVLDVIHVVLWMAVFGAIVAIVAILLLSVRPALLAGVDYDGMSLTSPWVAPVAAAVVLAGGVYVAGAIIIVGRLRRIFQTLIGGDPFHPDNARRLRVIGVALAALEVWRYFGGALIHLAARGHVPARLMSGGGVSLTAWFAVLAIVVLAEVFREGARLRGEAELTI